MNTKLVLPEFYDGTTTEWLVISSSEMEVRLVFLLNETMGWNLVRRSNLEMTQRNGTQSNHVRFHAYSHTEKVEVSVFENKSENGLMVPEWGQWDYVLKLDHNREGVGKEWLAVLKSIPGIAAVMRMENVKLRSIDQVNSACLKMMMRSI